MNISDSILHTILFNTSISAVWNCSSNHLFIDYLFTWDSTLFWTYKTV